MPTKEDRAVFLDAPVPGSTAWRPTAFGISRSFNKQSVITIVAAQQPSASSSLAHRQRASPEAPYILTKSYWIPFSMFQQRRMCMKKATVGPSIIKHASSSCRWSIMASPIGLTSLRDSITKASVYQNSMSGAINLHTQNGFNPECSKLGSDFL